MKIIEWVLLPYNNIARVEKRSCAFPVDIRRILWYYFHTDTERSLFMDQDNRISLEDVVEEQKEQAVTAGRIVHITAAIILLVAATLAFAFTAYFEVTYFVEHAEYIKMGEAGESQLGPGLGKVFSLVFSLIGMITGGALSIIGVVLSATVIKYRVGRERIFGIVSVVLNALYILAMLSAFIVMVAIA